MPGQRRSLRQHRAGLRQRRLCLRRRQRIWERKYGTGFWRILGFTQVQDMLDEMLLGGESFSFSRALKDVMSGEDAFTKEAVQELVRGLFFTF